MPVVVTVIVIFAVAAFAPVTLYVHEPTPCAVKANGPEPVDFATLATPLQSFVESVKPAELFACVTETVCAGPASASNESVGVEPGDTAIADPDAVGVELGVDVELGVGVGVKVSVGGVDPPPPPPPQAVSASSDAAANADRYVRTAALR
jgi:hypothetical protein